MATLLLITPIVLLASDVHDTHNIQDNTSNHGIVAKRDTANSLLFRLCKNVHGAKAEGKNTCMVWILMEFGT